MMRGRAVAIGGVLALALAAAPVSSAFAGVGHGAYGRYGFNRVVGPATAIVGVAAAIVTAPIVILAAASGAPYFGPGSGYAAASVTYDAPPVAQGYSSAPAVPVYYAPPAAGPYYGPPGARHCSPPAGDYSDNGNHGANGSAPGRYIYPR